MSFVKDLAILFSYMTYVKESAILFSYMTYGKESVILFSYMTYIKESAIFLKTLFEEKKWFCKANRRKSAIIIYPLLYVK
jgi:hypothetical protein